MLFSHASPCSSLTSKTVSKTVNFIHNLHVKGIRSYVHGSINDIFYLHNIYSIGCITGVEM